ncbi:MAG: hypothetical protein ACRDRU_01510 [Pseudonocardiaceae bacterium]
MDAQHTLDSPPRLYALHREEDEDRPAEVLAWGLAFPNDADVVWLTGPSSTVGPVGR